MKFDEQYIKTLERVFDLTKDGRTEEIENDFFAEHKGNPVNERDKEYIRMGFYKEWEK